MQNLKQQALAFVVVFISLFILGCRNKEVSTEVVVPPIIRPNLFNKGDVVTVVPKTPKCQLGIITNVYQDATNSWGYNVMFQETNLTFKEKEIELYQRALWNAPDAEVQFESIFP